MYGSIPNRLSKNKRALSKYSVGSDDPGLAFDFVDNVYRKGKGQTANLSSAITHARAGNATMTDGYGPELVTNGGFDSDSDWTLGTGWSISGGVAVAEGSTSDGRYFEQNIGLVNGKTYSYEINISGNLTGSNYLAFRFGGTSDDFNITSGSGLIKGNVTASGSGNLRIRSEASSTDITIDNVSVREMPVIKWAPHNLFKYSEEFDNAAWLKRGTATVTPNDTTAPDGSLTADLLSGIGAGANDIYQVVTFPSGIACNIGLFIKRVSTSGSIFIQSPQSQLNGRWTVDLSALSNDWELINEDNPAVTVDYSFSGYPNTGFLIRATTATELSFHAWGAHLYRSDLGGMADNPDQPPSRASYVPTTSAAKYLPRVGHHVYNGSAWVNEGVLAESESRVNLIDYSDFNAGFGTSGASRTANAAVSPDGAQNASELVESATTATHFLVDSVAVTASVAQTLSVYVKQGSGSRSAILRTNSTGSTHYAVLDFSTGTITETGSATRNATSQNVGNGWYRIAFTYTQDATTSSGFIVGLSNSATPSASMPTYTGDGTSSLYIYGAQFEQAETPSSLIPTSGSSVTRAAETFTIPSANLPWPTPQYIGSELVTNGTFDDTSQWTSVATGCSISGGVFTTDGTSTGELARDVSIGITAGKVYEASYQITARSAGSLGIKIGGGTTARNSTTGVFSFVFVADATIASANNVQISSVNGVGSIDNISVREINPLSVSIGMEGRMTYANTWTSGTQQAAKFFDWRIDNDNKLLLKSDSTDAAGERLTATHEVDNVVDFSTFNDFVYEGVLQSVNVALRVGSTFFQVAANGQTGAENATLTSLVDLSAADLDLVDDYMGTISSFRVWDKDIGDNGLVEATNPSLEPSLSLTFEGVGTNSFVVNNWSE